ncbi:glycoside hydrolase family 2 protein [Actinoplanes sp. LDG1-01]|uniref:beta-mannosidase n=2 Tax=Paractinoplanes lichenicola TaxID=2802976 RepID=A0ABS1VEY2_9ACTN|nr:glycoside hydrolase family 2 protein [Actinoplanes lichenicola]
MEAPATVPGCVHTDLLAAGLIEDPLLADNEKTSQWIGWADWEYRTVFPGVTAEQADLVFHGLDTVATITLNGIVIGTTENMHRTYRFPVRELLRDSNELSVHFASAERFAADRGGEDWPNPFHRPYPVIRKNACNFGWDWGPDLVTAGIWRPVELHTWHTARLDSVRPVVRRTGKGWSVAVAVEIARAADDEVTVSADVAGVSARTRIDGTTAELVLEVADPEVWWPVGHGEQPLYELTVRLGDNLDVWRRRIGFRTVELDTSPDEIGSRFVLKVNDKPVFARGVNWIPDDVFVSRVTPQDYRERLGQALEANVNLVRVWGGGLYESDDFYDVCDEVGLLVWQDFLFACAAYPEDKWLAGEVEAEAREQIVRLAPHPSLVLWNGNNENLWGYEDWGWPAQLQGRAWGAGYYLDLLPRLVAELDPARPYWAGSPWSGSQDLHPNDDRHGVSHLWDVWNDKDYLAYRDRTPRFAAEFGYQGPPAWSTVVRGIGDAAEGHQKAADGHAKLARGLTEHFRSPDDAHFRTQVVQARAVRVGVEHLRAARPTCMGAIWWQLNDCWAGPSWSVVDGDGRLKPAWYALRDAYRPRLIGLDPDLVVVNDTDAPWTGTATVTRYDLAGTVLESVLVDVDCQPRSALRIPTLTSAFVRATFDGETADWLPDLGLPVARLTASCVPAPGGYVVEVKAHTLLRELCLFPDRLDPAATVDTMLVTLLPEEQTRFTVRSGKALAAADLTTAPVLRCVNDGLSIP